MSPPAQPGGTPHGAPPCVVGPGPASGPVAGSGAKAPRHQALLPGCGAGLFVSAVTSRGRRHIPLRLQDRLAKAPLVSGMFTFYPNLQSKSTIYSSRIRDLYMYL